MRFSRPRLTFHALTFLVLAWIYGGSGWTLLQAVVVGLHETGHALGVLATGGEVLALEVEGTGAGRTVFRGGSPGVVFFAGYSWGLACSLALIGVTRRWFRRNQLLFFAGWALLLATGWDLVQDLASHSAASDLARLTYMSGVPAWTWVLLWLVVSASCVGVSYLRVPRSRWTKGAP